MNIPHQDFNPAKVMGEVDLSVLQTERPKAPVMSDEHFDTVFGPWAQWLRDASEVKSAPLDFTALALLSTSAALIGNARWAVPWDGWKEPCVLWAMLVGDPSSGKSPALDAVLVPVKAIDAVLSKAYLKERAAWSEEDELAKLRLAKWKADAKAALAEGDTPPEKPKDTEAGPPPVRCRVRITDTTIEKAADLVHQGWRGLLLSRDELSGWLGSMDRYNGGGDRPFWLEAFGGRGYTVDRKSSPEPIVVDHLSISVLGGAQPDKLDSLLVHSGDDGLLARFIVVYPSPAPLRRPTATLDTEAAQEAMKRLRGLNPVEDDEGNLRPYFIHLDEAAQQALQEFRIQCREWEGGVSGLMKSHAGKLPGLSVRVAMVLALLDWAMDGSGVVSTIEASHIGRACHYVGEHLRHHAHRAYGAASLVPELRAASQVAHIIKAEGLRKISSRDIQRRRLPGLQTAKEIAPAFTVLEEAGWISRLQIESAGRTARPYAVHPDVGVSL